MKTCCDYECAEANFCQVGGIKCERCHGYFCANELGEYNGMYICDDCKAEIEAEVEEEMRMSSKKDLVGYIDPNTIDLELAYQMTKGWCFGEPPKTFSFESDALPKVIDFAELRKVKPPMGYKIGFYGDPEIRIVTSCFDRSIVWNSTHIFCDIKFFTCYVTNDDGYSVFVNPATKKQWKSASPFNGFVKLQCNRRITEEDLKYGQGDWTGFSVGDMVHRWSSSANAIECAKRIIELRFRNYGKIEIEDCEED